MTMNKKIEDLICIAKIENVCENPSELNDTNENFKFMESANYIVVATSHYLFDEEPVDINSKDFAQDWINAFKKSKYYKVPDRRLWINTNHIFNGVYCQYSKNILILIFPIFGTILLITLGDPNFMQMRKVCLEKKIVLKLGIILKRKFFVTCSMIKLLYWEEILKR